MRAAGTQWQLPCQQPAQGAAPSPRPTPPFLPPSRYAFRALIPIHFFCQGAGCPTLIVPQVGVQGLYAYVSTKYELDYFARWENLGYLAIFVAVFQLFAVMATRYIRHIVR